MLVGAFVGSLSFVSRNTNTRGFSMLTQAQVRSIRPNGKPQKISDGGGLHLYVSPVGGKSWRYSYRFNGKQRTLTLGQFPSLSIEIARKLHREAREAPRDGADPGVKRTHEERTFEQTAREWHAHWSPQKSAGHALQVLPRLEADVFPSIGSIPIIDLTAASFRKVAQLTESRGAAEVARRNLGVCGQIMRYAVAHDYLDRNPVVDVKPGDILKPSKKRNYPRVFIAELPQLLRDIEGYVGGEHTRLGLKLLALTFVRTQELIGATWSEYDLEAARWDIPPSRMKMARPHVVPLSRQALEVLRRLKEISWGSPWVLPHETKPMALHMSNNTLLYALYRLGYRGRMTGHGFRGIASTILHEREYQHEHIELQLAHAESDPIAAAYHRPRSTAHQLPVRGVREKSRCAPRWEGDKKHPFDGEHRGLRPHERVSTEG